MVGVFGKFSDLPDKFMLNEFSIYNQRDNAFSSGFSRKKFNVAGSRNVRVMVKTKRFGIGNRVLNALDIEHRLLTVRVAAGGAGAVPARTLPA